MIKNMIDYIEKNNCVVLQGVYKINQAWGFKDGKLLVNKYENGKVVTEERNVFEFIKK